MRAGVLSYDPIINFLNDNFINTWVPNSELGRIRSLREPIDKRREREGKAFDTTHPLAQAIIKGWKTGSKAGSPVDCFVISPTFELMGKQQVNEIGNDCRRAGLSEKDYYLTFLKEALAGNVPGLGNIVLTPQHFSQTVSDLFHTPITDYPIYTVIVIDVSAFENGGMLTIDVEVGREDGEGEFYLLDGNTELPTEEKIPKDDILTWIWRHPCETGQITHHFDQGQLFKLGVIGYSDEAEAYVNAFHAKISVEEYPQVESVKKEDPESDENIPEMPLSELSLVLDKAQPSQEILDAFRAPGSGYQDYTVINIDTTAFEGSGTLIIDIRVGGADISGSFDLFDGDAELPTEGYPDDALNSTWGIGSGKSGKIRHRFTRGSVFKFGATGDWYGEKGRINAFQAKISVVEN